MEKTIVTLSIRKMRGHLPQLLGMGLLVLIGVAFFVTLYTIYLSYEQNAEQLFASQQYADITFYGSFDKSDVEAILAQDGIDAAQGRRVQDYQDGDITLRAISITDKINTPYLYEGSFPQSNGECLLNKKHAQARDIKPGDVLTLDGKELRVSGIAASAEYVYLVQNERALMAGSDRFGVVFVNPAFFDAPDNEIVAAGRMDAGLAETAGMRIGADRTVLKADQPNYNLYREDLDQIRTFAYIFPLVFALLIVTVIYIMLKRTIAKERRQIGVYKALGVAGSKILYIYIIQTGLTAIAGAVLGLIAAMLLCNTIIGLFSVMFEVPNLAFTFYPGLWAGAVLVCVTVCALSALVSVSSVMKPLPSELMRGRMPAGGKRLLLERMPFLWSRLSFNTRYSLKSALRNKGRFWAAALGMCGSCALLTFAFGFFNSVEYTERAYFENFAHYDVLLEFDPIPLNIEHPAAKRLDRVNKALAMPVKINGEACRLIVVENDFDMQRIETSVMKDGIILPEYYAGQWGARIGGTLRINDTDVKIAGLSEQSFGLALYTSYGYVKDVFPGFPSVYNVMYAKTGDLTGLADLSRQHGFEYATLEQDRAGFTSIMKSLNTLIWFMLACAVILGLTVLYSVGLMNLSSREYEYMFMGVMGYPLKSIMLSHVKETALQLLLAIPAGFLLGHGILGIVKTEFSGSNFVILTAIYPQSYVYAGAMAAAMAAFMALVSARRIDSLDIVEGLKARDE